MLNHAAKSQKYMSSMNKKENFIKTRNYASPLTIWSLMVFPSSSTVLIFWKKKKKKHRRLPISSKIHKQWQWHTKALYVNGFKTHEINSNCTYIAIHIRIILKEKEKKIALCCTDEDNPLKNTRESPKSSPISTIRDIKR